MGINLSGGFSTGQATGAISGGGLAATSPAPASTAPKPTQYVSQYTNPYGVGQTLLQPVSQYTTPYGVGQTLTGSGAGTAAPDPRDAEYWANLAKLQSTSQQQQSALQLEQSQADTNYGLQLTDMAEARRRGVRNLAESMIGSGLLRSGYHNRSQTEATTDYLSRLTGVQTQKGQEDARRQQLLAAIAANLGLDQNVLYSGAASRYAQHQADLAANAQAMGTDPLAAAGGGDASAPATAPTATRPTSQQIDKAKYIINHKSTSTKAAIQWAQSIMARL